MHERIVVVTNPNSTRAAQTGQDVIGRLRDADVHFTHVQTDYKYLDDNIAALTPLIETGDTILPAGGDGTMLAVSNAFLANGAENVAIAPLAYGNFNDMAGKQTDPLDVIGPDALRVLHTPLSIEVNHKLWRYAPAYLTLGFTARAAAAFEQENSRAKLKSLPRALGMAANVLQLGTAYFEHRNLLLPAFHTSHSTVVQQAVTDVLFLNHDQAGRIIKSRIPYGETAEYGYIQRDVRKITSNLPFGFAALVGRTPAEQLQDETLTFTRPASIPAQTDGEVSQLEDVSNIRVFKDTSRPLTILRPNNQ